MITCAVFDPALQVVCRVKEYIPDVTIHSATASPVPYSRGLSVARCIRTLEEEVGVVGMVGRYSRELFAACLDDWGIEHQLLEIEGNSEVHTVVLEESTGTAHRIVSTGRRYPPSLQHTCAEFWQAHARSDDWCVLSGPKPQGFDDAFFGTCIEALDPQKRSVFLDSSGEAFRRGLHVQPPPQMIKPNLSELEEFFQEEIRGIHHIALKGKRLLDMGVSYVFISLGSDGMIALHGNDCLLCGAPQIDAADPRGCGDAMAAGLIVAHRRGFSFTELSRLAVACGSANALHFGVCAFTADEVWRMMEQVTVENV